jgi:cytochrome b561
MKTPQVETKTTEKKSDELAFKAGNFKIMLLGILLIIAGFIIMTLDKEEFGFGFMGLTLGPVIAFIGFMIQFYAILKKKS